MSNQNPSIVTIEMGYYCFDVLINHLNGTDPKMKPTFSNQLFPLFVTWYTLDSKLRGCIGTFNPLHLHDGLKEYALTSALSDSRFNPITLKEIHNLEVHVSVLTDFQQANDCFDWDIGKHGIRIELKLENGRKLSATYLPEVAKEAGWSKTETIDSLLRKAGYNGRVTPEIRNSIKLTRYQSQIIHCTYHQYNEWLK